jgi:hypothetical protein
LTKAQGLKRNSDTFNNTWFLSNQNSLFLIATGLENKIYSVQYQTPRQKTTIENGYKMLCNDIKQIKEIAGIN